MYDFLFVTTAMPVLRIPNLGRLLNNLPVQVADQTLGDSAPISEVHVK